MDGLVNSFGRLFLLIVISICTALIIIFVGIISLILLFLEPDEVPLTKEIKPIRIEMIYNEIDKRTDTVYYYNKKIE